MKNVCSFFKSGFVSAFAMMSLLAACSGNDGKDVVGGASGDAGVVAVKDWEVAGVSQKGPFVTGSAVTVQELDGITLKQTGKSFKGTIKSDKGDFAIKDINLESQYAILEASGYYRDEISGKKSSGTVTLRALTDLSNRKTVNINLLTHLEYERVMHLVTEKKKSIAEAKEQAEKEILASFYIDGDYAESEDLNIFESGDGNAALLAVSVLMQSDVDVAGLTERIGEFSISLAEGGSWDDADAKTAIADWACDIDLKGSLSKVRKNVEGWKYADTVPAFEKYVSNFWWDNYGLGVCNDKRENETKRNINKLSALYNEYFVCEKGRWHIPGDEPESSSSKDGSSSSGASSSSSTYNPFNSSSSQDSLSVLPPELQFFEEFCSARGPVIYGDGEQRVWTCTSWANVHDTATRDSAASALVDTLGAKGFVFEKTMLSDSLKSFYLHSFYDSLSYIYSAKKGDLVYKIAMTKTLSPAGAGYGAFMFDVAIFLMKEGFEDLPIHVSSSSSVASSSSSEAKSSSSYVNPFSSSSRPVTYDSIPELPKEVSFLERFFDEYRGYLEFEGSSQKDWFVVKKNTGVYSSDQDSLLAVLADTLALRGFAYKGKVACDSVNTVDAVYEDSAYVYERKLNGLVYKVSITKWWERNMFLGTHLYDLKIVILEDGAEEIPSVNRNSLRFETELPEEVRFLDGYGSNMQHGAWNDDSLTSVWTIGHDMSPSCKDVVGCDSLGRAEVEARADSIRQVFADNGFALVGEDSVPVYHNYRGIWGTQSADGLYHRTIYEKETEKAKYSVYTYGAVSARGDFTVWYICVLEFEIHIYYKSKPE